MIPILFAGAALLVGAVVVGVFWNEIKDFINKTWEKIKKVIIPAAIAGFKTYLQTGSIARALFKASKVAIQKFYSRLDNGKWKETTVAREISFEDLPNDIQAKLARSNGKEVDISDKIEHELQLEH